MKEIKKGTDHGGILIYFTSKANLKEFQTIWKDTLFKGKNIYSELSPKLKKELN